MLVVVVVVVVVVAAKWVPMFFSTLTPHHLPPPPPPHVDNKFVIPYSLFFNYYYASVIALEFLLFSNQKFLL
jgi:hypothetical protein